MDGFIQIIQEQAENRLRLYRETLSDFKATHGGVVQINADRFYLFGMGNREKLIYEDGKLKAYPLGRILFDFRPESDYILPADRRVVIFSGTKTYEIFENEEAVFIADGTVCRPVSGTEIKMSIPDFEEYPFPLICRVLYDEILFNITAGKPVPSYGHYRTAWYRDGAMVAMCLKKFGHIDLIRDWILNLDSPYDFNRGRHISEPDNLGEALYLISTVSDKNHPLVPAIIAELRKYEVSCDQGIYLDGVMDSAPHPLYITKWAKFGLRSLGLLDPYVIPADINDDYSELFWMDFMDADLPGENITDDWPYLTWASDHYHKKRENCRISDKDFPLTWEGRPSNAPLTCPHTWHSSEALLYLTSDDYPIK